MTLKLEKGGNADLTKQAGGDLSVVRIGLGWDARKGDGEAFDLDASVIGLADNGLSAGENWFVFYNRLTAPDNAIVHQGDELTGAAEGDDEQIVIDFTKIPANVHELAIAISIHQAATRGGQNFGQVDKAYVRVVNEADGVELARYDLSEDGAGYNTVVLGKCYRGGEGWKFKALGDTSKGELAGLVELYKIS